MATAEEVTSQRTTYMREVLIASGFAAPLFARLYPTRMTNAEIDSATAGYQLFRIRRIMPARTNPADLVWLWIPVFLGLFIGIFQWYTRNSKSIAS